MKHSVPVSGKEAAPEVVQDLPRLMNRLQGDNEPFVLATVVRTISVTAAKAGAKAVIDRNGDIVGGWIGGGCARSAVIKAARSAFEDGQTRLISLQPRTCWRRSAWKPVRSAKAFNLPRICARARERWISS